MYSIGSMHRVIRLPISVRLLLAFLAMCHFKLGEFDVANDFRNELVAGVENNAFSSTQLNQLASQFLREVNQVFESGDNGKP